MFWHKKHTAAWPLVLFGLIALGIIVSTAVLLIITVRKFSQPAIHTLQSPTSENSNSVLQKRYLQSLQALSQNLQQESQAGALINSFENAWLTLRVPAASRGAHLQAWLNWLKAKPNFVQSDSEALRQELLKILQEVIASKL